MTIGRRTWILLGVVLGLLACAPSAWASVSVSVMPPSGVHAGVAFSGQVAAFTDSDPSDTAQSWVNRVNVDWGDRSPPVAGQVSGGDGSFVIGAAHTYSAAGTYTITVSVLRVVRSRPRPARR